MKIRIETPVYTGVAQIRLGQYGNGRLAFGLDAPDGQPLYMATVNVPEAAVPPGHVLVKTWSENRGLLESLVKEGVLESPVRWVPAGYATAALCPLGPRMAHLQAV